MTSSPPEICLDSQCVSYVIDALKDLVEPTDKLAEQKIALVRSYFYIAGTFWTTPTVVREVEAIRNPERKAEHDSWRGFNFPAGQPNDPEAVKRRADELETFHAGINDRLILAEAEDIGFSTLLSFDGDFVKHLGNQARRLTLTTPAAFWESRAIPRGAPRKTEPTYDNPLAGQTWWRWDAP